MKKRDSETKVMLGDLSKISMYLSRLDESDFLIRLDEARKRSVGRKSKIAIQERKRISDSIIAIENELIDLSIIAFVRKQKANAKVIASNIKVSDKKLRERLKVLLTNNKIKQEKLGKYTVYAIV